MIQVASVPITASSTEDDYFVLYVKHTRGPNTTVDVPVLVKRGESGTTSLTDNLSPLDADKYRVEKYLVSNPADIDGDCVDDITEVDDFGHQNPMNPAFPFAAEHGAVAIEDRAAFENLSYQGHSNSIDVSLNGLEYVKFTILNVDSASPTLWFQNTNSNRLHWGTPRFRQAGFTEFVYCCWRGYAGGVLIYHPNVVAPDGSLGVYRWEFSRTALDFQEVSIVHQTLAAAMPFLKDNLAYYPFANATAEDKYERQKSSYGASRINVLMESDIRPDVEYTVYNEAEGYGLLGVFEPGESPGPRDVAILSVLPNDLPRAAGVITTVPQTPLSHVNLRAIQNGTPNAFIRDALTDEAVTDLVDSYVYYRTTADGFTLRAATKSEVDTHHSAARPKQTQTLRRDLTKKSITSLSNVSFADWTAFGVKAANVAELTKVSLPTGTAPVGYAVPFYFYDEFMKQATVSEETILGKKKAPTAEKITLPAGATLASAVTQMLAHSKFQTDADIQKEMLSDLRKAIKNASSPTWIITALTTMHGNYPNGQSLRYRSSTNNEDLPSFNGAGLYDSKTQDPDETTDDGIDKSIKAVWASLWNYRAFLERDFHRVDHTTAAMGVLVHPNYSDEKVNGVAVSFDPISSLDGYYYVNTQLGEDLVTNPEARSLPEELLLDPAGAATVLARSNLAPANKLFMTDAQMIQLRSSLKAIHDHFRTLYSPAEGEDFAIEIEFKITAQNKLAIKQARPWVFTQPLSPTSEISVVAGSGVTEGRDAEFTITASPAPASSLDVTVEITQNGDFVQTGSQTVAIPTSGSFTLAVPTANDSDHETDGSVTATVNNGAGYTVSTTAGSATVTVSDDDLPPTLIDKCVTALTGDGIVTGEWTDQCDSVGRSGRYARFFTFSLDVQTTVRIDLESSWDTYLFLRDGLGRDGQELHKNDDGGNGYNSRISESLASGDYTIEATTFGPSKTGAFTLKIAGLPDQAPPAASPEVSVAAGSDITEGGDAIFTISASPTPAAPLSMGVNITQSGDFGVTTGAQTISIPTSGSYTLTVSTNDDSLNEANGSVTATVNTGTGYTVSKTAGTATVVVADDDQAVVTPEIRVTAGDGVTEGDDASFTISANPTPKAALSVSVAITQSGDFGVAIGPQTISIPTSGSYALTVSTNDDSVDEADGSVTATVNSDTGYTVSTTTNWATVTVSDDDDSCAAQIPADAITVSEVTDWRDQYSATTHQSRWNRVLAALGEDTGETAMTAAQALDIKSRIDNSRWDRTVRTLEALEDCNSPPPPTPEVSVAAGSDITEGDNAVFTISASPTPQTALSVNVTITQSGDFGATTGAQTVSIPINGSYTLTVATTNDSADEANGSVTATVNTGTGYTVSTSRGTATVAVTDNDVPLISVTAGGGITEGGDASFTISASPTPQTALSVNVTITQSGDFGATTGAQTVSIPTSGSYTLTVATTNDSADEANGSVTATVNTGTGYTVSTSRGTATVAVTDNDVPLISVTAGGGITEGGDASFTISASPTPQTALSVNVTITQSGDFGATTGAQTVSIPTSGSYTLTVATTDDSVDEEDGLVTATVDGGYGYTLSATANTATVAVADDDPAAEVCTLPTDAITVSEVTGWRDQYSATTHQSRWNRVLTALGEDTGETAMTTAQALDIKSRIDNSRWDRTVRTLEALEDCNSPPPPTPEVSVAAGGGVTEGGDAVFTVSASPTPAAPLSVSLSVSQSGDFGITTGVRTISIPTGGSYTLIISTSDDSVNEANGSVTATVNSGSGYAVSNSASTATVAVADNDQAPTTPEISVTASGGITEGGDATFTITANPTPQAALSVRVSVSQNGDFGATTGARTITIPTGGSYTLNVATTNDSADEANGSVTATVNTGTGYAVSTTANTATVVVADNDVPQISVTAGGAVTEGEDATFTLTASPTPAAPLSVNVNITQSGDYGVITGARAVIIPTSGSYTLTISTSDDNADEADGSVTATADSGSGYTVASSNRAATVAVSDDDPTPPNNMPSLTISDGQDWENSWLIEFHLELSKASSQTVTATIRPEEGTATWGGDFQINYTTTYTILPGETRKTIYVVVRDDNHPEDNETFRLKIISASGATIADAVGDGLIMDND